MTCKSQWQKLLILIRFTIFYASLPGRSYESTVQIWSMRVSLGIFWIFLPSFRLSWHFGGKTVLILKSTLTSSPKTLDCVIVCAAINATRKQDMLNFLSSNPVGKFSIGQSLQRTNFLPFQQVSLKHYFHVINSHQGHVNLLWKKLQKAWKGLRLSVANSSRFIQF